MAKKEGEPEYGTKCERCGKICDIESKTKVSFIKYYRDPSWHPNISSNHKVKTTHSYNFCSECIIHIERVIKFSIENLI